MKASIEVKVAAAMAIAFAVLSIGAIAEEQREHGTGGLSQMSLQGTEISLHANNANNASGENQLLARH